MINLDSTSKTPLYIQIYEAVRDDIVSGKLRAGSKLEPIRKLAKSLDVSHNTVENAYAQLLSEGYVASRSGSGYVVCDVDFSTLKGHDAVSDYTEHEQAIGAATPSLGTLFNEPICEFDFTYGNRPRGSFPEATWRRLTGEALLSCDNLAHAYGDALGEMELREEIARRISVTRGVNCKPEQVVLQAGTQAALGNLLDLFDARYHVAALENPGYDGAAAVFRNRGFQIKPLNTAVVDDTGKASNNYIAQLYASGAKLVMCYPSNQFPMGKTMPLATRVRMIEWATQNNSYILEDDYCREFRYDQRPIPSLQSIDTRNRVVYMGTLSKVLSPALRMSYLVLPPQVLDRWREVFSRYYCPVPWLSQKVLYLFMKEGYWDKYTRKTVAEYRNRRDVLIDALQREMGDKITIHGGSAGLHLLVSVSDGRDEGLLVRTAASAGVRVYPTSGYWLSGHGTALCGKCVLIGFSSIECERIPEGIHRLAQAWFPNK